jgi:hypothetical protein
VCDNCGNNSKECDCRLYNDYMCSLADYDRFFSTSNTRSYAFGRCSFPCINYHTYKEQQKQEWLISGDYATIQLAYPRIANNEP